MRREAERLPDLGFNAKGVGAEIFSRRQDRHCDRSSEFMVGIEIALAAVDFVSKTNVEISENASGKANGVHTQPCKHESHA